MRRSLLPLVPLYAAAQALNTLSYERQWRHIARLRWPVVSIGNLSVGGAGKTPFVIALARLLAARGWQVDVLSRGYGRASSRVEQVDPAFSGDAAARYGDEPWLITQAASVPVFVAADRASAGRLAEQRLPFERGLHLLDDGLQHRRLARDIEIVLLHRSDFDATLLPAGRLREPLAALERADFVVLREEDEDLTPRARRWMRADAALWSVRRELELPELPGPVVVFSAIAHPQEFAAGLRKRGIDVAASLAWRDHHRFTVADVDRLRSVVAEQRAASLVTTEKDWVRLTAEQRGVLELAAPLRAARLSAHLEEGAIDALETRLKEKQR